MEKRKPKTEILVCGNCGKYKKNGKWAKPTIKALFDLWIRSQKGEEWQVIFSLCRRCEVVNSYLRIEKY